MTEYDFSPQAFDAHQRKMRGVANWAIKTSVATSSTFSQTQQYTTSPTAYVPRSQIQPTQPHSRPRTSMDGQSRPRTSMDGGHHMRTRGVDPPSVPRPSSRQRTASNARPPAPRSRTYSYSKQPQPQQAVIPNAVYPTAIAAPQPRREQTMPAAYGTNPNTHVLTYDPRRPVVLNPQPGYRYEVQQPGFIPPPPVTSPTPRQAPLFKRLLTMWRPSSRASSTQQENRTPRRSTTVHHQSHPPRPRSQSRENGRHSGRSSRDNGRPQGRRVRRNSVA